jgi:hypothetical protein
MLTESFFNFHGRFEYDNEAEFDDKKACWDDEREYEGDDEDDEE